tara:strand:- start:190 stop:723 length:534 start_codon:yes stop_codon:yes gene_type:complete
MVRKKISGGNRKTVLSIGITIIFVMFIAYALETIYPSPDYEDFCDEDNLIKNINSSEKCEEIGGKWIDNLNDQRYYPGENLKSWCDQTFTCRETYEESTEEYNRNVFFISLILGILTFIVSVSFLVESVSTGFMGGGVLLIIYGTMRYWGSLSDIWRTIMLGFALGVLVWIGYKKLK